MRTSQFHVAVGFVAATGDAGSCQRAKHSLPADTFAIQAALAAPGDIASGEVARAIYSMRNHI
jgi:hypothetical protein